MFKHVDLDLPKLSRETIDGVRYYSVPEENELIRLVSITSVTSHFNKEIFVNWRKRVGNEEAKGKLKKIDNIYSLEGALYSRELGIAGTVDCIAEYDGELSIIDFKTSKKPKPREWIEHYFVQAMAYGCMLYELTGISVKKLVIIMACENGECVVYEEYDKTKYIKLLTKYIRKFVGDKLDLYGTK